MYPIHKHNTTVLNESFSGSVVDAVWQKATIVLNYDPNIWRKDRCGAWIKRSEHGNTNSEFGWEIDHDFPKSRGGGDEYTNLQPLQWENNRHKGDNYPSWSCKLTAN